ncbi:MAG: hypothetical protein AB7O56_12015 [Bauldia sp.]
MRRRIRLVGLAALAALALPGPSARAQDFVTITTLAETIQIEDVAVRIDVATDYRIVPIGAASVVEVRLRIGLADVQAKAAAILTALAARQSGGTIGVSFPRLDPPVAANGAIRISGLARIATRDPVFGAPIVETGQFTLALRPAATDVSVGIQADLVSFQVGGGLMVAIGIEDMLRDALETELRQALAQAPAIFTLPPELLAYGIRIGAVDVVDFGGLPGLVATASATLDGAQLMTAVIDLAAALGP